jgi:hypothetical protein
LFFFSFTFFSSVSFLYSPPFSVFYFTSYFRYCHTRYFLLITLFSLFSYSTCSFTFAWPVIMCFQDEKGISSNLVALTL